MTGSAEATPEHVRGQRAGDPADNSRSAREQPSSGTGPATLDLPDQEQEPAVGQPPTEDGGDKYVPL